MARQTGEHTWDCRVIIGAAGRQVIWPLQVKARTAPGAHRAALDLVHARMATRTESGLDTAQEVTVKVTRTHTTTQGEAA